MLIDTHAHINFDIFKKDADEVIRRALTDKIWIINVGVNYKTSKKALEYANKYEKGVYAAAGLHPLYLLSPPLKESEYNFDIDLEEFHYSTYEKIAQFEKVVAIGEVGLDYYRIKDNNRLLLEQIKKYQQEIFYLGHLPALSSELTSLENLDFLTKLNKTIHSEKLLEALYSMNLKGYEYEYCNKLSAGQKRRVILAGLLVSDAKVWLLDEPFTALDPQGVDIVERCIVKHCEQGGVCLFTTHHDSNLNNHTILAL